MSLRFFQRCHTTQESIHSCASFDLPEQADCRREAHLTRRIGNIHKCYCLINILPFENIFQHFVYSVWQMSSCKPLDPTERHWRAQVEPSRWQHCTTWTSFVLPFCACCLFVMGYSDLAGNVIRLVFTELRRTLQLYMRHPAYALYPCRSCTATPSGRGVVNCSRLHLRMLGLCYKGQEISGALTPWSTLFSHTDVHSHTLPQLLSI